MTIGAITNSGPFIQASGIISMESESFVNDVVIGSVAERHSLKPDSRNFDSDTGHLMVERIPFSSNSIVAKYR